MCIRDRVHSDGWGFNVKIDYLPLNGAEIVIRKPKVEEADAFDHAGSESLVDIAVVPEGEGAGLSA